MLCYNISNVFVNYSSFSEVFQHVGAIGNIFVLSKCLATIKLSGSYCLIYT
jgi:hypothetical protein